MAHQHTHQTSHPGYDGPEHFWWERHNAGLIAAWAIGLLVALSAIGLMAVRLRA